MLKSLLITLEFPPQKGGVAIYYKNVVDSLPSDKIQVLTVIEKPQASSRKPQEETCLSYKLPARIASEAWRARQVTNYKTIWPRWLLALYSAWRIVKQDKIEQILVGQVLPIGTIALIIKKFFKIPYVVFTHGMDILTPQGRKKKLTLKIFKEADKIVANSNFTKGELIKLGVQESKISVVYPCVQISDLRNGNPALASRIDELKRQYNLQNKRVILSVGRLVPRKGFDKVIEAMTVILEKVPNAVYVILGEGSYYTELEKLANQYGVRDRIIFLNYESRVMNHDSKFIIHDSLSNTDRDAWFEACDLFIMPSRQIGADVEGFGIVYLEANAHGKPVIGGNSGGVPEAIFDSETGLLVDPLNVDKIAKSVIRLLQDEEFSKKIGQKGKERALNEFNFENFQRNIELIFKKE